jgi:hypothetical protein
MAGTDAPSPIGDIQHNDILDINNANGATTLDLSNNDDLSDFGTLPHRHENTENTGEAKVIAMFLVL